MITTSSFTSEEGGVIFLWHDNTGHLTVHAVWDESDSCFYPCDFFDNGDVDVWEGIGFDSPKEAMKYSLENTLFS